MHPLVNSQNRNLSLRSIGRASMAAMAHAKRSVCRRTHLFLLTLACLPQVALADLPSVEAPSGGGGGGGIMGTVQGYAAEFIIFAGLLVASVAFIVVATTSVGKFREAQKRNEWGDFGMTVGVGAILIVVVIWLATQAADIL